MNVEVVRLVFAVLVGGGGVYGLRWVFTLRETRRSIGAGASAEEANAAATMSDVHMRWVIEARDEAKEAKAEAATARRESAEVRGMLDGERDVTDRLRRENGALHAEIAELRRHVDRLTRLIQAAGLDLPISLDPRQGGSFDDPTH